MSSSGQRVIDFCTGPGMLGREVPVGEAGREGEITTFWFGFRKKGNKMDATEMSIWQGPYRLRDWILTFLDGLEKEVDEYYPPEKPGVYAVTMKKWKNRPEEENKALYVGCSDNLLARIHDLIPMLLGFYESGNNSPKGIGRHPGWKVTQYCINEGIQIGGLFIGWAATEPNPCYGCVEVELVKKLKPKCQKGTSRVSCRCTI
jgi:hypothetical protein